MERVNGSGPAAVGATQLDVAEAATTSSTEGADLLPQPTASGSVATDLARLWVLSLQGDRAASRKDALGAEQRMLTEGKARIASMREAAKDEWRGAIVQGVSGIVGGSLKLSGASLKTPEAGQRNTGGALASGGNVVDALGGLGAAAYAKRADEHGSDAAAQQLASDVASRRADRHHRAADDAAEDVSRTLQLLEATRRAENAAANAALIRG